MIVDKENMLNNLSTSFNNSFILDVIEYIYPGIKDELSYALINADINSINSLMKMIEQVMSLEDLDYDSKKLTK